MKMVESSILVLFSSLLVRYTCMNHVQVSKMAAKLSVKVGNLITQVYFMTAFCVSLNYNIPVEGV